ncbi:MAG: hypothetical protein H6712_01285 [Myxococcales bacterium]|nr:hypothetical protein [Myxococcales bacterium]
MKRTLNLLRFARTFVSLVRDPDQLERVFDLGERVAQGDLFEQMPWLRGRPEIEGLLRGPVQRLHLDVERLASLPPGTVGREYADFITRNGLDPAALDHATGTGSLERFRIHLQGTHDLWHVATGFDTDVDGEIGLQAFYYAQLQAPLPLTLMSAGLLNSLLLQRGSGPRRVEKLVQGYLMGRRAAPLTGLPWSAWWQRPLSELRRALRIDPSLAPDDVASVGTAA